MNYDEFERRAWQEWERIPDEYRAGVDGLVVERSALPHPSLPDIYTLGECVTESYPSEFGGPDTTRSLVVLYHGSFFRLARNDPDFDWEGELWETLTHELQHHLESLAADDALIDMDYAADENYKRYHGEPFDPFFFRHGLPANGWYRVEDEYFLDAQWPAPGAPVHFVWDDAAYDVDPADVPDAAAADVAFLRVVDGVSDAPGGLHLVLVARRGLGQMLRSLVHRRSPRVADAEVVARRA